MNPIDVPTRETSRFVLDHMPSTGARLLEVGAGEGEVAQVLVESGHDVIAVDSSPEAVAIMKAKGLCAHQATWPHFVTKPVDVVLFTRSLHHIHPLEGALDRARRLLKPGGKVIVEDFAYLETDENTVRWLYHQLRLLAATGVISTESPSFGGVLLRGCGRSEIWAEEHDHELHTAGAMVQAIQRRFVGVSVFSAPYLYRYLCSMEVDGALGVAVIEAFLGLEAEAARQGGIRLVGRRMVGIKSGE